MYPDLGWGLTLCRVRLAELGFSRVRGRLDVVIILRLYAVLDRDTSVKEYLL
jgi:hypothetical protein